MSSDALALRLTIDGFEKLAFLNERNGFAIAADKLLALLVEVQPANGSDTVDIQQDVDAIGIRSW